MGRFRGPGRGLLPRRPAPSGARPPSQGGDHGARILCGLRARRRASHLPSPRRAPRVSTPSRWVKPDEPPLSTAEFVPPMAPRRPSGARGPVRECPETGGRLSAMTHGSSPRIASVPLCRGRAPTRPGTERAREAPRGRPIRRAGQHRGHGSVAGCHGVCILDQACVARRRTSAGRQPTGEPRPARRRGRAACCSTFYGTEACPRPR